MKASGISLGRLNICCVSITPFAPSESPEMKSLQAGYDMFAATINWEKDRREHKENNIRRMPNEMPNTYKTP